MAQFAILSFVVLCSCIALAICDCVLEYPSDSENVPKPENKPKYKKFFGKHEIDIPYSGKEIRFGVGEKISAYCANRFERLDSQTNPVKTDSFVEIYCKTSYHEVLGCEVYKTALYQSVSPFSWCPTESFILASKLTSEEVLILAAACIDVERRSLQTLHYLAGPKINTADHNALQVLGPIGLDKTSLDTEVKNFNQFFEHLEFSEHTKKQHEFWLKLANYGYDSIVQSGPYVKFFNRFDKLLDILWWPNLAAGNWKRFMDTLDERTKNFTYNVFVGTSGVVQLPHKDKLTQTDMPELQISDTNRTVPAYVWTYLQATESSEEFVFIGYNAPTYDFFPEKNIIFCEDICGEVAWLNDIRSTFRYSALGVTFCCSVEAVRSSNLLEGFPVEPVEAVEIVELVEPVKLTSPTILIADLPTSIGDEHIMETTFGNEYNSESNEDYSIDNNFSTLLENIDYSGYIIT